MIAKTEEKSKKKLKKVDNDEAASTTDQEKSAKKQPKRKKVVEVVEEKIVEVDEQTETPVVKKKKVKKESPDQPENVDRKSDEGDKTKTVSDKQREKRKEPKRTSDEIERTVFCGNLPLGITRKDVQKIFAECGKVESVSLRSAASKDPKTSKKVAVLKQEFSDVKDNINAYVRFSDKKDVENAMKINGNQFGGHFLQVDKIGTAQKYDNKRSVFIGNLAFTAVEDDLRRHFEDCGDVERVRIVRDKNSGVGKGFGFVVFKDGASVDFALKLNEGQFDGRALRVTRVFKKFKKSKTSEKPRSAKKFANKTKNAKEKRTKTKV